MSISKRKINGERVVDPSSIEAMTYNEKSGSRKSSEVGRSLLPIPTTLAGSPTWTTNVTTATPLPQPGRNLAVYNNSGAVQSINFSNVGTLTSLASGAVDANGNAGLPCMPNAWSYFAAGESNWVIASSASLLVFLIDDDTRITVEAQQLTGYNFPGSGPFTT